MPVIGFEGNNALLYEDFITIRDAKKGDIVTLSDGKEYEVGTNVTRFSYSGNKEMGYIPYGRNNTFDNR